MKHSLHNCFVEGVWKQTKGKFNFGRVINFNYSNDHRFSHNNYNYSNSSNKSSIFSFVTAWFGYFTLKDPVSLAENNFCND